MYPPPERRWTGLVAAYVALIIAISPLVDERFVKALQDLMARTFTAILLTISPVPVTRALMAPSPVTDIASRLWNLERAAQLEKLRKQGMTVLEWQPEESLEVVLSAITRRRRAWRVGL